MGNGLNCQTPQASWYTEDAEDLGPAQEVQVACTPVFELAGFAAYHSSLVLGRVEYHFGPSGVVQCPTRASSTGLYTHATLPGATGDGKGTEVITVGLSSRSGREMMEALVPHFQAGTYDLCLKNCNTFTDMALFFLLGERLGKQYMTFERTVAAAGPTLLSFLDRLLDESKDPMLRYVDNPLAKDFSVEEVVSAIKGHHASSRNLRSKGFLQREGSFFDGCTSCRTCANDEEVDAISTLKAGHFEVRPSKILTDPSIAETESLDASTHTPSSAASTEF